MKAKNSADMDYFLPLPAIANDEGVSLTMRRGLSFAYFPMLEQVLEFVSHGGNNCRRNQILWIKCGFNEIGMRSFCTHAPLMQAAAKTSGVIWQADEMGAVAIQEATGSLFEMSHSIILPS